MIKKLHKILLITALFSLTNSTFGQCNKIEQIFGTDFDMQRYSWAQIENNFVYAGTSYGPVLSKSGDTLIHKKNDRFGVIAMMDTNFNFIWYKRIKSIRNSTGGADYFIEQTGLSTDADNNIYLSLGTYGDTVYYGDEAVNKQSGANGYNLRIDKDGNLMNTNFRSGSDFDNRLYPAMTGYYQLSPFRSKITFFNNLTTSTDDSVFSAQNNYTQNNLVSKMTNDGHLTWGVTFSSNASFFSISDIKEENNSTYIFGTFRDTLIVDGIVYKSRPGSNLNATFICKLNHNGDLKWLRTFEHRTKSHFSRKTLAITQDHVAINLQLNSDTIVSSLDTVAGGASALAFLNKTTGALHYKTFNHSDLGNGYIDIVENSFFLYSNKGTIYEIDTTNNNLITFIKPYLEKGLAADHRALKFGDRYIFAIDYNLPQSNTNIIYGSDTVKFSNTKRSFTRIFLKVSTNIPEPFATTNLANLQSFCPEEKAIFTASGSGDFYTWNNSVINGEAFLPEDGRTYTVTSNISNTCFKTFSVKTNVYAKPPQKEIYQFSDTVLQIRNTAEDIYTYEWYKNDTLIQDDDNDISNITINESGDYYLVYTLKEANCIRDTTETIQASVVGLDEVIEDKYISVYPNPTDGALSIIMDDIQQVIIYNQLGEVVSTINDINNLQINNLSEGYYTLLIHTHKNIYRSSVIKK